MNLIVLQYVGQQITDLRMIWSVGWKVIPIDQRFETHVGSRGTDLSTSNHCCDLEAVIMFPEKRILC